MGTTGAPSAQATRAQVTRLIRGLSVTDGAGVSLTRIIGSHQLDAIDPFVLLDEFRSDDPDDYIAGFPWHPHRGIETITYMIEGKFRHEDSRGGGGELSPGSVQWMTAGKGILHQEMPAMEHGALWGYQLWLNLPKRHKMVEPNYQHLTPDMIPVVRSAGCTVYVISGRYGGRTGLAENRVPATYLDVRLKPDARFSGTFAPKEQGEINRFGYVHTGSVIVDPDGQAKRIPEKHLFILDDTPDVLIESAANESGFLFFSGIPNNEPIARGGPFVMNTQEEIAQAFADYRNGTLF